MSNEQLDQLAINTIRTLSMDAVQQANTGQNPASSNPGAEALLKLLV